MARVTAFVVVNLDGSSYTIIAGGKRIASSSRALQLNQYSDTYIAAESTGYYALYNFKGKKLTKTYQNAFNEVGQNILQPLDQQYRIRVHPL